MNLCNIVNNSQYYTTLSNITLPFLPILHYPIFRICFITLQYYTTLFPNITLPKEIFIIMMYRHLNNFFKIWDTKKSQYYTTISNITLLSPILHYPTFQYYTTSIPTLHYYLLQYYTTIKSSKLRS